MSHSVQKDTGKVQLWSPHFLPVLNFLYPNGGHTYTLYISCHFLFRLASFCVICMEIGNLGYAFLLPSSLITFHRREWDDDLYLLSRPHNFRKYFWSQRQSSYLKILVVSVRVLFCSDRLCGLVVRVSGYRYRGLGSDSRRYLIFWVVVGLERCPLSLVRSIEELLE